MTGATHVITSVSIAVYMGYTKPMELAVIAISSLLPDIDRKNSLLGRFIPVLPTIIELSIGKRTLTHSLAMLIVISTLMISFGMKDTYLIPFLIGFVSHLLLDLPTGSIALLFPIPKKFTINFGIPPVFIESAFLIAVGVYYAFYWREMIQQLKF